MDGTADARIIVKGAGGTSNRDNVVLRGAGGSTRMFEIKHDYYTIKVHVIFALLLKGAPVYLPANSAMFVCALIELQYLQRGGHQNDWRYGPFMRCRE